MISFFFTFLVLYILLKASESNREDVSGFMIVSLALIPALAVIVLTGVLRPVGLEPVVLIGIRAVFLGALTFGLLWKFLGMPVGRSLMFAAIVIFVSEAPFFMIFVWPYGPG